MAREGKARESRAKEQNKLSSARRLPPSSLVPLVLFFPYSSKNVVERRGGREEERGRDKQRSGRVRRSLPVASTHPEAPNGFGGPICEERKRRGEGRRGNVSWRAGREGLSLSLSLSLYLSVCLSFSSSSAGLETFPLSLLSISSLYCSHLSGICFYFSAFLLRLSSSPERKEYERRRVAER